MPKGKLPTLDEFADKQEEARFAEHQELSRGLRAARGSAREAHRELDMIRERLGLYERLDPANIAPPKWLSAPPPKRGKAAIPTMLLTDVHWGEIVKPPEVGGVNKYNVAIATARVREAFVGAIKLCKHYLSGVRYEGFNLLLGGDMLSGIIHEELRETNEETVFDSILSIVDVLVAGVVLLAEEFPQVHIAGVVGNHSRLTRKPRAKHRAHESLDWLVYQLLARGLEERKKCENVTVQIAEAADGFLEIYKTRYCLTHGDQFRGGSGISGAMAPLLLGVHRKRRREADTGRPFDVMVMGHFHYSYFLQDLIVGGSVVGYNEYAYVSNLPFESPRAALWLNTPEHGITVYSPVFVQKRDKEGW